METVLPQILLHIRTTLDALEISQDRYMLEGGAKGSILRIAMERVKVKFTYTDDLDDLVFGSQKDKLGHKDYNSGRIPDAHRMQRIAKEDYKEEKG